jgi:hypothetical protein
MSKAAAIHMAISLQMASEDKDVPNLNAVFGTITDPPAPGRYNRDTIRGFLANIAFRLRTDTPAFEFKWTEMNTEKCLTDRLWVFEQDVFSKTTEVLPNPPREAGAGSKDAGSK